MSDTYTIFAMHCLFARDGAPVVSTNGSDLRPCVIMEMATWNKLCRDFPGIAKASFNVGTVESK